MIKALVLASALAVVAGTAQSQSTPAQPLRIIVPFPPGNNNDIVGRTLAQSFGQISGQTVIVDNRSGAEGMIGADVAARSSNNGRTMLLISVNHAIGHSLYTHRQHDLTRDFSGIGSIGSVPYFVAVNHQRLPVTSLAQLIRAAKETPGQITFGTSSTGTGIWVDLFSQIAQVRVTKVSYQSQPQVAAAAAGGEIQAAVLSSQNGIAMIGSGRLQGIATTGPSRSKSLPNLPAVGEQGWPKLEVTSWYGLLVPRGVPPDTIAALNQVLNQSLATDAVTQRFANMDVEIKSSTPRQLEQFVAQEVKRWAQVVAATPTK
jgi:tripartite-type tricarboxylate transporter receptor subunit TctC